jgi:hypothetical protein
MPRRTATVLALSAAACSGHVLYPAWLAWATRRHSAASSPDASRQELSEWPAVTVLVPAFREAGVIAAKVKDVMANGYRGPLEVLVVADGDAETADAAESAGARVLGGGERQGKAQALNRGFANCSSPIVVISDANNRLVDNAIAALVRHFADPSVGAATGAKLEEDGGGESLYWKFESWLKTRETTLGTTIGLVGELTAFRAAAWEPIPADVAIDDLWAALDLSARGWRIEYEPEAQAVEPAVDSLREQWERRTRSVANAMHVFVRQRRSLGPSGGLVAAQVWGHRLGRYTISPAAHLALGAMAVRTRKTSRLAQLFLVGHGIAFWGIVRPPARGRPWRAPVVAASQVVFLQAVAVGGVARFARGVIRGERRTTWRKVER